VLDKLIGTGDVWKSVILVECYDHDAVGSNDLIGTFKVRSKPSVIVYNCFQTTTDRLFYTKQFDLVNPSKKKSKKGNIADIRMQLTHARLHKQRSGRNCVMRAY
jgi:hypothetical protein